MTTAGREHRERSTGLRYGWTTGACATAATTAAYTALLTGEFPDPVTIDLPVTKPGLPLGAPVAVDVVVIDRGGTVVGRA